MEQAAPNSKLSFFKRPWVQSLGGIILIAAALAALLYWKSVANYVVIDTSQIIAPVIPIGPETEGILSAVYVKAGDQVKSDQPVAQVGSETLATKTDGLVLSVSNTPGQVFMPGSPVVSMIVPGELRVVGKIDEDKGLARIKIGNPAYFTVDAFGGNQFTGVVDEISPTANQTSVVFNISDQREIRQFEVKVRYNVAAHPEFKNGMSAKLRIYVGSR